MQLIERTFNSDERKAAAKSGAAMPDGSFPIENKKDLENAIRLAGHSTNPAAAKSHIKKRAKALGCTDCIPDTWESYDFKVVGSDDIYEEAFVASDSHDGLRSKLSQAIDGKVQSGQDMDGDDDGPEDAKQREQTGYPLHYVQQVHDNHVIYSMSGKNFAQKYNKDDDGDVHLKGNPQEVEHSFTPVKAAKESFSESIAFEVDNAGKTQLLCESFGDKGEITFTVIKPGWSKNNRYYPADMLKKSAPIFEGAKMFVNHATEKEATARPEGNLHDWVANVTKVWPEADGTLRATAKVIDPQFKAKLALLGESKMLPTMGVSIRAIGTAKPGEAEGRKGDVVESLTKAASIDFVTFAGAGGQVENLI
jgi:hypothetical protein